MRVYMSINDYLFDLLKKRLKVHAALDMPPSCMLAMEMEYIDFNDNDKQLIAKCPIKKDYLNPMKMMQGGFIIAAIDNVLGPLSYLVAPPSVTTQLNCNYLRPVTKDEPYIIINARVISQTKRQLFLQADVLSHDKKLLVSASAATLII
jgi:uncharacterized protein (TIGR00369 family)